MTSQLISQLFPALLSSIAKQGQGLIPTDFLNDLDSQVLDLAKSLGQGATELLKPIGEGLGTTIKETGLDETAEDAGKAVEQVGKAAEEGAKDVIEGIFGGDKKEK